jgi:hypothetical protein
MTAKEHIVRLLRFGIVLTLMMAAMEGETVQLKDGRVITGTYVGGSPREVRVEVGDHIQFLDVADILRIEFDTAPERRGRETSPAADGSIDLPAGTNLVVRMIDAVDSERDSAGQTFAASLDGPVLIDGQTVVLREADVVVKLVDERESGKLTGRTALTLDLMSLNVNGPMVDVNAETVREESSSRGARTAKVAGGTAVSGTIIGAIAGGGKGAAIGLGAGAAAGTAAEIVTKGQRVRVPSESRLTFVLENAVRL